MNLALKSFKFAFMTNIGHMNDTKIKRLEIFKERFPIIAREEGGQGVIMLNPGQTSSIVLLPDRVVFDYNGEDLNINPEDLHNDINELVELLILDSTGPAAFHYIANLQDAKGNAMQSSLDHLPLDVAMTGITGLGLRFLFETDEKEYWEFKVEPLIKDRNYYFIESISNFAEINIDNVTDHYKKTYNFYNEKIREFFRL